jgi:hypothetical protein
VAPSVGAVVLPFADAADVGSPMMELKPPPELQPAAMAQATASAHATPRARHRLQPAVTVRL